ncbi:MAG: tRNA (adenosine(37)-N6)-dimethylallyltransferase MiaA [Alphaproteobacteria bacterium]
MKDPRIPVIFGPTASGKSALALALAERLGGAGKAEIVNADSRQIYKYMPIIAACPTAEEYGRVPHHLYEFVAPDVRYSAGEYATEAARVLADVVAKGKTPIVVGGTGLYLRALMEGMSPIPPIDDDVVARVEAEVDIDVAAAYARLQQVDGAWAARIMPRDAQRIARGLSVWEGSGRTLTAWQGVKGQGAPFDFVKIGLCPPRPVLHERIIARWKQMAAAGVVDEIRGLKDRGYTPALGSMKGLGIPELFAYIEGTMPLEAALEAGLIAHRQYAKRQETWLRNQFGAEVVLEILDISKIEPYI